MGLIDTLWDRLLRLVQPIIDRLLGPVKPLITIFNKFRDNTIGILEAGTNLTNSAIEEYEQIRDFKVRPAWRNRIVSVPTAVEKITSLAQVPTRIADALRDLVQQLKGKIQPEKFNLDELEGIEDLRGLFARFGAKLASGLEKILGVVTIVVDALVTIRSAITDLQTIVDSVREVREDIENLDLVFLSQKNPRRTLITADGETFKIRVGSLHSS